MSLVDAWMLPCRSFYLSAVYWDQRPLLPASHESRDFTINAWTMASWDTLGETCGVLAEFRLDEEEMECIHGGPGGGFALLVVKDAQGLRQAQLSRLSGAVVVAQAD